MSCAVAEKFCAMAVTARVASVVCSMIRWRSSVDRLRFSTMVR